MLKPSERLSYQDILKPVSGYDIDYVIATTYSLDINALLLASLSLANYKFSDADMALSDPLALLKSLRNIKDKFVVFCQNDRIAPVEKANELIGFLDNIIITIKPMKGSSYHPKVWIVRMINGKDVIYRVAVLSRNLTFDKSWDIAVSLEGKLGDKEKYSDFEIFIKDLIKLGGNDLKESAKDKLKIILKELPKVEFELPEDINDLDFIYQNPGNNFISSLRGQYNRMLVISPFITEDTLETLVTKVYNSENDLFLISRPEQLDQIKNKQIFKKFKEVYCLNDGLQSDEYDEDDNSKLHGLHAKIIIAQKGYDNYFYAGSSNATNRGMKGINYEFMVKLVNHKRELNPKNILEDEGALKNMIIPYVPQTDCDNTEKEEQYIKDMIREEIVRLCKALEVKRENETSNVHLLINQEVQLHSTAKIYCWLVGMNENDAVLINDKLKDKSIILGSINEALINSFISFQIKFSNIQHEFRFTLKLPLIGAPEDRETKLLNHIIKNSSMFFKYLMMLMGSITGITSGLTKTNSNVVGYKNSNYTQEGILDLTTESLLRCYAIYPERFKKIQDFMKEYQSNKAEDAKLPDNFVAIWKVFEQVVERNNAIQ